MQDRQVIIIVIYTMLVSQMITHNVLVVEKIGLDYWCGGRGEDDGTDDKAPRG